PCCSVLQAEDCIRDRNVTGVQTCALPIFVLVVDLVKFQSRQLKSGWEKMKLIILLFEYVTFSYTHALKRFVLGHFNMYTENSSFPFINTGESISMKEEINDAITTLIKVSKVSSFVITCSSFARFIFH